MKNLIVGKCMSLIIKDNKYDETKLQEIKYGLEALYLNISKFLVFFIINILIGNFKESLLFLLFYAPLRSFSYGFHAKSSIQCWIISGLAFIGIPMLTNLIYIDTYIKIIVIAYSFLVYGLCSPSDTSKRPLVNANRRLKLKIYTLILISIYMISFFYNNQLINTSIVLALLYQSLMISPITYKLFNQKYDNYLSYGLNI